MEMPFRLDGLKAVVTGGASGIGEATCRTLAEAGATVTIVDVDRDRADAVARGLSGASVCGLDVTDESAVNLAMHALPDIDIPVNNAGIGLVGTLEETASGDFRRLYCQRRGVSDDQSRLPAPPAITGQHRQRGVGRGSGRHQTPVRLLRHQARSWP
jgi:hypothetical protein